MNDVADVADATAEENPRGATQTMPQLPKPMPQLGR